MIPIPSEIPVAYVPLASSMSEPRPTVLSLLNDWLLEPFLTGVRFVHLAGLFLPVIFLVPVVFLGKRERLKNGQKGDRAGAVWWYGVLVKQMQRAGPSFIKVSVLQPSAS